jgi:hypothetical protein
MYVERIKKKRADKTYSQVVLRESYRKKGAPRNCVSKRTLLNLTRYPKVLQDAVALAVKRPERVVDLCASGTLELHEGKSVGAVWAVTKVAERLGIVKALGRGRQAELALWQIVARVIEQGSRLSAVRLHQTHALADVIGLERGFNEDDLYDNLAWLCQRQAVIEKRLFKARRGSAKPSLFLYDVTSSYLEGDHNELAAYGYNRDGKKGKKQIVIGLLCDGDGEPVSVEVFAGNTQDPKTLASQIRKTAERFGCSDVTFVGDRGMIKRGQMEELSEAGFHYITAITKPQIEKLMKDGALQLELFDVNICEVQCDGRRLILRRNPVRADELAASRSSKHAAIEACCERQNHYLSQHPKAKTETALKRIQEKIDKLRVGAWLRVQADGRTVRVIADQNALEQTAKLDGCYVIVTDLVAKHADAQTIHDRYKDLARVERGFRMSKTGHLELRPIYVRSEKSTRGHVFVVMLAYLIRRELQRAWSSLDLTVEEGLDALKTLCSMTITLGDGYSLHQVPTPRAQSQDLLNALQIQIPPALPSRTLRVATKRKLPTQRVSP